MPEEIRTVRVDGKNIVDKHTHYEAHTNIGPYMATVQIPGHVAIEFREKYGRDLTSEGALSLTVGFVPESELDSECRDVFRSGFHRRATVRELAEISAEKK
ncbi:MAG: hypothetical protein HY517_03615 [Candidatus Aenigmarchaeota archaeon]|nr:hypothetical protein [Candidatus Aenigmarchaeota archaeon]